MKSKVYFLDEIINQTNLSSDAISIFKIKLLSLTRVVELSNCDLCR